MAFSHLYSSVTRGKWFILPTEVDANQLLINSLLTHDAEQDMNGKLSERSPLEAVIASGKEMRSATNFSDAPANSTAIIALHGTMLKYGTYCSYGCVEVAEMIEEAANSPKISGIILDIDSGGGAVDAIAPILSAIKSAQDKGKPVVASCDLCASAAYYVAVHCNEIIAANTISAEFGSIGVMMSFMDYEKYYEAAGVKVHTVYSNHSEYKNAAFEAAKKGDYEKLKDEELDPIALQFQSAVKSGRGDKLDLKVEGIIDGRMFYAEQAKKNGLIDSIGSRDFALQRVNEIRRDAEVENYINSKS